MAVAEEHSADELQRALETEREQLARRSARCETS